MQGGQAIDSYSPMSAAAAKAEKFKPMPNGGVRHTAGHQPPRRASGQEEQR